MSVRSPATRAVDVRDDERPARRLERDVCERLVPRHDRASVPAAPLASELVRKRLAEGAACRGDLLVGSTGRDLQGKIEGRVLGEEPEQVIQNR
jgi:hypothetical protein